MTPRFTATAPWRRDLRAVTEEGAVLLRDLGGVEEAVVAGVARGAGPAALDLAGRGDRAADRQVPGVDELLGRAGDEAPAARVGWPRGALGVGRGRYSSTPLTLRSMWSWSSGGVSG